MNLKHLDRQAIKGMTTPSLYLSTSDGKWRTIYRGLPLCKDMDTEAEALRSYALAVEQMNYPKTDYVPVWDGEMGLFR